MVSLSEAVVEGRLEGLRALRDTLAREIEQGPASEKAPSQTAPLARQLRDVLADIAELEKLVPKGSVVDDLAHRRVARFSVPEGDVAAGGSGEVERG